MDNKTYTNEEVQANIEELTNSMEKLKLDRTEMSQNINALKKQIAEWLALDKSQFKMFD